MEMCMQKHTHSPSLPCSVIKRDGCCARRSIQSLLRASVQDVNIWWQKIRGRLYYTEANSGRQIHLIFHHCLTLLVHKNWCCPEWCNCVDQEEAVVSGGIWDIVWNNVTLCCVTTCSNKSCVLWGRYSRRLTFCRCLQCHRLGDRGRRRTLHVWGKTRQACVLLRPKNRSKKKEFNYIDVMILILSSFSVIYWPNSSTVVRAGFFILVALGSYELVQKHCAYLFNFLIAEISSRCFYHSMYIGT